jgi:hypothetical protein
MKPAHFLRCLAAICTLLLLAGSSFSTHAQGILFYARTDGAAAGLSVPDGNEVHVVPANVFTGANPGAAREIAFDPETRLLWYSATDNQIYSVNVDTQAAGPSISGIPGGIIGGARHVYIDYARRHLLATISDGSIQKYDLATQQSAGSIPANFFTDGNIGEFRHVASDVRSGTIWYAATDGSFREMNPDTLTETGRMILFNVQTGANPGAFRHFVVDHVRNLLLYAVTDGSIASIDLTTLQAGGLTMGSNVFSGANPGAGRIITYDLPILKPAISPVSGNQITLNWQNLGSGYQYTVEFRDDLGTGSWAPLPPVNQWPSTGTSLANVPASETQRYYRVVAAQVID